LDGGLVKRAEQPFAELQICAALLRGMPTGLKLARVMPQRIKKARLGWARIARQKRLE